MSGSCSSPNSRRVGTGERQPQGVSTAVASTATVCEHNTVCHFIVRPGLNEAIFFALAF